MQLTYWKNQGEDLDPVLLVGNSVMLGPDFQRLSSNLSDQSPFLDYLEYLTIVAGH